MLIAGDDLRSRGVCHVMKSYLPPVVWIGVTYCLCLGVTIGLAMARPDPAPSGGGWELTCYTCVNVSDNHVCNRFAIDRPCPPGLDFCHTLHAMDEWGRSTNVNKKCARAAECEHGVGCVQIDRQLICVSCCDQSYCNEPVPTDYKNAIMNRTRTSSGSTVRVNYTTVALLLAYLSVLMW